MEAVRWKRATMCALGAAIAAVEATHALASTLVAPAKPNVLYIIGDDMRPQWNVYCPTCGLKTPNLDALASDTSGSRMQARVLDHTRGHIDLEILPDLPGHGGKGKGGARADCRFGARRQPASATKELHNMHCLR